MSSEIDPYRDWLGIKSAHRPPNHYELLDLKTFESDRERIENAVMIEMAKVLRHENGPHAALATQIGRELEEAVRCLLDPGDKAAYDAELVMTPHAPAPAVGDFQVRTFDRTSQPSGANYDFSADLKLTEEEPLAEDSPGGPAPPDEHPPHRAALSETAEEQDTLAKEQDSNKEQSKAKKQEQRAKAPPPPKAPPSRPAKKPKARGGGPQFSLPEVSAKKLAVGAGIAAGLALAVGLGMLVYNLPPGKGKVLAMIGDAEPQVRIQGLYALRNVQVDHAEAATLLLKVLRDEKDEEVRLAAVNALIENGVSPSQSAEIQPLLAQEQNPMVKELLKWLVPAP